MLSIAAALLLTLHVAEPVVPTKPHWAWVAVRPQTPPPVKDASWIRNPIDRFILAKLEAVGIAPAAPASREQWIRRVSFDLIGLPPTPAEIDAFVADSGADAWEKVIDRLLASPHYGERWGRHWLDAGPLCRLATAIRVRRSSRPDAWKYRDWVDPTPSTADLPFDRFIHRTNCRRRCSPAMTTSDQIVATGFHLQHA